MLTLHPAVLKNYLEAAANAIEPFTIWPSPYGDVALLVISALYLEEKSPGISMWKRALDDMPVLTHHGQHISDICMETIESALMQESGGELHEGTLDGTLSNEVLPSNEKLGAKATSNTRCRDASLGSPAGMAGDRFKLADLRASLRTSVRMSVSGYSYASPPGSPKRTQATKPRRSPLAPPKHSTPDSFPHIEIRRPNETFLTRWVTICLLRRAFEQHLPSLAIAESTIEFARPLHLSKSLFFTIQLRCTFTSLVRYDS